MHGIVCLLGQMSFITDILLMVLATGCATVGGQDALTEMGKDVELLLDNQQQLFNKVNEIKTGLKALRAQYACQFGRCTLPGRPIGLK